MADALKFLEDAYRTEIETEIVHVSSEGFELKQTVFYPATGITPGDTGQLILPDGSYFTITKSSWSQFASDRLLHVPRGSVGELKRGDRVKAKIDWLPRYAGMKVHTALHVASTAVPYPAIGGSIGSGSGYVTFLTDNLQIPRKRLTRMMQRIIDRKANVEAIWIPKPLRDPRYLQSFDWPESHGLVRAINIENVDLQPCDGLHVRNTNEIGVVEVTRILRRSAHQIDVHLAVTDKSTGA